jgi:hypothetical protein
VNLLTNSGAAEDAVTIKEATRLLNDLLVCTIFFRSYGVVFGSEITLIYQLYIMGMYLIGEGFYATDFSQY